MRLIQQEQVTRILPKLTPKELATLIYHDIFDYPLTYFELIKWSAGEKAVKNVKCQMPNVKCQKGFYFFEGREGLVLKRALREKSSRVKLKIAKKAAKIIGKIPTVKMVAITGALTMENTADESDVDLMVITRDKALWTTRLATLFLLDLLGFPRRKFGEKNQKDKLCLNIWLEESNLVFRKRNIFTAHEIAQIKPLVNKQSIYERFIYKNRWTKEYWPNAARISDKRQATSDKKDHLISQYLNIPISTLIEPLARTFQLWYMRNKKTKEVVTPTRAMFHPVDWSKTVLSRLETEK